MHTHVRRSLLRPGDPDRVGLVESGIGPEQEMTEAAVLHEISEAATLGAKVFFLDASWYTDTRRLVLDRRRLASRRSLPPADWIRSATDAAN